MHRPGSTEEYIIKQDRESENPTTFILRGLTWKELDDVNRDSPMSVGDALIIHGLIHKAKEEDRELNNDEQHQIRGISPLDAETMRKVNQQHAKACGFGLVEVGDILDEKGEKFTLKLDEFIKSAPIIVIRELGAKIINMSRYSEDAVKN